MLYFKVNMYFFKVNIAGVHFFVWKSWSPILLILIVFILIIQTLYADFPDISIASLISH